MKLPETSEQLDELLERVIKVAQATRLDANTIIKHLTRIEHSLEKNPNYYVVK